MLSRFIQRILGRTRLAQRRINARKRSILNRPSLESLEGRRLLAFTTPVTIPVNGISPAGIAVGDYNTDGRDDMAVVNSGSGTMSILLANADGSFAPQVDYAVNAGAVDASMGDLNGDGKLDLVAVSSSAVDVLLGNGDGTFGPASSFAATLTAHSVKVGDFNNDSKMDIGTTNSNSASVMLGNGDGTVQAPLVSTVLGNNINLVTGDFDHDGNLDMATSNTASNGTVNVLRGRGDGSFQPYNSYYAFSAPVYLATGDFNEDGYLDFACPNSYVATSMSVLLNNGDGTYSAPHTYGIAQTGYEIEVEDFNNDGHDDFAVRGGSSYMVSMGKGDGTFYPSVSYSTPNGRFEAGTHGDFNGDGAMDLAYPTSNGVVVVGNDNADYQNLAGAVTFRLTTPATTTSGSVLPMTIEAVDANGDVATGFRGLVYISSSDPLASTASGYAFNPADAGIPYVFTATDAGSHTFTGAIRLVTAGDQQVRVSAPNMQTAISIVNVTGQVTKLNFAAPATSTAGDSFNITVSAIDTTGAAAPGYSSKIHFASSDALAGLPADYTFTPADAGVHTFTVTLIKSGPIFVNATEVGGRITGGATVNVSAASASTLVLAGAAGAIGVSRPVTIVARDQFGNFASSYAGTLELVSSDPAALFPPVVTVAGGTATVNVKFLTVGNQTLTATDTTNPSITGTLTSNATPPVASAFQVAGYPATTAGNTNNFTVSVIDTIGQVATGFQGTVFFSSSDIQAGLPASYTFTSLDAGVHKFAATMKTAGAQSITVRDSSGSLIGTQSGINVTPAAFSHFQMSVPNGADSKGHILVAAGDEISLRVEAVDNFGNATSDYTGTVHVSSSDSLAVIPADYAFSAADAGVHIFPVQLGTATVNGQVSSFSAVDTLNATTLTTKTNFEVVNGAATSFKVALPANIVAGESIVSKVTALDAFGNTVKNYFGTVHLATSAANAELPSDYTFDSSDLGVHDFSLSLNTSGSQTLSVVDTQSASVLGSDAGNVTAASADHFAVTAAPSTVAGNALQLTVRALDAFGNIDTNYRGTVTLASSDSAAVLPAAYTFRNNDAGVATLSVVLKTVGTQSVSISDSTGFLTGSLAGISVTPSSSIGSFVVSGFPSTTAGIAQSFTVKAKDVFGNFTNAYVGTVVFSSSDAQAGLPASYTFTAADAGVHTFSATLRTAGVQSITVKDSVTATAMGTQSGISVTASSVAAASFAVTGFPATTAGAAQNFTVSVRDAFGNLSTGYTGTVTFSSSDVKAGLPASYTFNAADAGVHIFSATLKTAGAQSITVKDSASASIVGTQSGIQVTAAAAASFVISAPTTVTSGVGFTVTVKVYDAYGNVATGYRGKITLSSTDSKAGSNSFSFGAKDNGVATISYKLSTLGAQTLKVVDTANAALSASLAVTVASKK